MFGQDSNSFQITICSICCSTHDSNHAVGWFLSPTICVRSRPDESPGRKESVDVAFVCVTAVYLRPVKTSIETDDARKMWRGISADNERYADLAQFVGFWEAVEKARFDLVWRSIQTDDRWSYVSSVTSVVASIDSAFGGLHISWFVFRSKRQIILSNLPIFAARRSDSF